MKYIVGIDLGTTNCTVSYSSAESELPEIKTFPIEQYVDLGVSDKVDSLPSFIYFPLENERELLGGDSCIGLYARERAMEIPERAIFSAKSWLCHVAVDRRSSILPLGEYNNKISPVDAMAKYLSLIKDKWNTVFEESLEEQEVLVTVPASFDPDARQMIQEALKISGYPQTVVLLEEPQAALYAWIYSQGNEWRNKIEVGNSILVVDIGGGTSDFSLVKVSEVDGELLIERTAVGEHLLLGGDNIDCALAYYTRNKLEAENCFVDDLQMKSLVSLCRSAKENIFSGVSDSENIIIKSRGRSLVGSSVKVELTKAEIEEIVLNGFIPIVEYDEKSIVGVNSALSDVGLPYVKDPRITVHIANFLSQHIGENEKMPSKLLFNGGVFKGAVLQNRIVEQLKKWSEDLGCSSAEVLEDGDLDHAVSCGAVYYGFARQGRGIRIKSSVSRSYFIGVEESMPTIPGIPVPMRAVCVVPYGMEEGSEAILDSNEFALLLGQKAHFKFMSCNSSVLPNGSEPKMGSVVASWKRDLQELHPIESFMEGRKNENIVKVRLLSKVTELGTLELWCIAEDDRKWKLEFDLRG